MQTNTQDYQGNNTHGIMGNMFSPIGENIIPIGNTQGNLG